MTIEEYGQIDKTFNRSKFISDINRMMQKIYESISNDNLESIKYFISENVYKKYQDMIQRYKDKGLTIKYDNVVIDSEIKEITKVNGQPQITVNTTCNYSKYYTKDGEIVSGDDNKLQTIYNITVTKNEHSKIYYCCEGCGKSFDAVNYDKCPNCGSNFIEEKYDYTILFIGG